MTAADPAPRGAGAVMWWPLLPEAQPRSQASGSAPRAAQISARSISEGGRPFRK
jgi:hypothetical protein